MLLHGQWSLGIHQFPSFFAASSFNASALIAMELVPATGSPRAFTFSAESSACADSYRRQYLRWPEKPIAPTLPSARIAVCKNPFCKSPHRQRSLQSR